MLNKYNGKIPPIAWKKQFFPADFSLYECNKIITQTLCERRKKPLEKTKSTLLTILLPSITLNTSNQVKNDKLLDQYKSKAPSLILNSTPSNKLLREKVIQISK
jgi:hypothetical protein